MQFFYALFVSLSDIQLSKEISTGESVAPKNPNKRSRGRQVHVATADTVSTKVALPQKEEDTLCTFTYELRLYVDNILSEISEDIQASIDEIRSDVTKYIPPFCVYKLLQGQRMSRKKIGIALAEALCTDTLCTENDLEIPLTHLASIAMLHHHRLCVAQRTGGTASLYQTDLLLQYYNIMITGFLVRSLTPQGSAVLDRNFRRLLS